MSTSDPLSRTTPKPLLTADEIVQRLYQFGLDRGDVDKDYNQVTHDLADFVEEHMHVLIAALNCTPVVREYVPSTSSAASAGNGAIIAMQLAGTVARCGRTSASPCQSGAGRYRCRADRVPAVS